VLPAIEAGLLIGLTLTTPKKEPQHTPARRIAAMAMIVLTSIANAASLVLLVDYLLKGGKAGGEELLYAALNIFLTNIIVFALWYWELDGGGPSKRHMLPKDRPDFFFPQYDCPPQVSDPDWRPTFIDFFYVSTTNATAFSPTDTLPLTHQAKLLMLVQALISLMTIALVAARAVNILQ
jgi:uncharacterized membrane protein